MTRSSVLIHLVLCLIVPDGAAAAPIMKDVEVNGVRLPYVEEGSGEPIVFVHGSISDLRAWDPIREDIAKKYRFIAYSQRYFGTTKWTDDGKTFSAATHAADLAKFIVSLDAGPVHVVGWSYGGAIAATTAVKNPSLFRSLTLYEASLMTVLPAESADGKAAREDRGKMFAPAVSAAKAGEASKAARLVVEAVFQLPPGASYNQPRALQMMWEENARTTRLQFAAPPPPAITCEMLKRLAAPTLLLEGEKTSMHYRLINDGLAKCIRGARRVVVKNVNHDAPVRDPSAFSAAIIGFVAKR
jgi:pimeloyl-ACP methyl ester carboxylesterase